MTVVNDPTRELERLISRFLDDEASGAERRELRAILRRDPAAEALFEETAALDRELGRALRRALRRQIVLHPARRPWAALGRAAAVAAAACLAVVVWWQAPLRQPPSVSGFDPPRYVGSSWFAPPAPQAAPAELGDSMTVLPAAAAVPHQRVRSARRDWILIPGDRPGEVLVIEVQRTQTRLKASGRDF
jgi:hypothetical protein